MRAHATASDSARQQAAANRARRRHQDAPSARLAFRAPGAALAALDPHHARRRARLRRPRPAAGRRRPAPAGAGLVELPPGRADAYLLAGRQPPLEVDGRWEIKLRDEGHLPLSGYSATRALGVDRELPELARPSTIPLRALQRWTPERREHELARLRAEHAAIQRAERAPLADLHLDAEPRS